MKTAVGIVLLLVGTAVVLWSTTKLPAAGERDTSGGLGGAALVAGIVLCIVGGVLMGGPLE